MNVCPAPLRRAAALAVLCAAPVLAQQPAAGPGDSLTLAAAIDMAQQRSHAARAARATRDAARYRDQAFGSRQLPQLALTGTLPNYNRSIVSVQVPDTSGNVQTLFLPQQQMQGSLALRLSQRLPLTGGELFVTSQLAQLRQTRVNNLGTSLTTRTWSSAPFSVGLRQDILRPNVQGWDNREQGVRRSRDQRAYLEALEDVALQTADLFFTAYAARVALANAESNAAINDTLYRMNSGRLEIGRIGENDLLQSQLALLRARTTLEGARLEYERAMAQLRIGLGLAPDAALALAVTPAVPDYEVDTARAVREALANRSTGLDAELSEVQARRRVAEAKLASGVGATVFATYGYNSNPAPSMNLAYQDLLEAQQLTVSVSVPLWQWGARGENVRAAEAERDRAVSQSELTSQQTALDGRFAALQLLQARRNVMLLATADTVANRRFEVAYNRYVIGRINIDNLYIAQNEKDQALTQYVQGLQRFWQAHYRLRRTTLFDFATGLPIR